MKRALFVTLLCLPLASCATNAVLELTFDFPAASASGSTVYAVVQARPGNDFGATWAGSGIDGVALSTAARTPLAVSIVADEEMVQRGMLAVRVHFCGSRDCSLLSDGAAPELQYVFERAFYRGKVTRYTITVASIPSTTPTMYTSIPKCSVAGCIGGATTNYCHDDGGVHYCE